MRMTVVLGAFVLLAAVAASAAPESPAAYAKCTSTDAFRVLSEPFGSGEKITLVSPYLRASLLTTGATLFSVQYCLAEPGEEPRWVDVALGFDQHEEFVNDTAYMGRTVGRYAGRIARGEITLGNYTFPLDKNEGGNTLHGGTKGFSFYEWVPTVLYSPEHVGVRLEMVSPHNDQGFPGTLHTIATYTLTRDQPGELKWRLEAELTEDSRANVTVVNLCNHVYWNLNGIPINPFDNTRHTPAPITNHEMLLYSSHFLKTDEEMLPWGEVKLVKGTPHDFRTMRPIKDGMEATAAEGRNPAGYDDPVSLDNADGELRAAAALFSPTTNIRMDIRTTSPAIVMYTLNHLPKKATGERGDRFQRHSGIAMETQFFPNSPHVDVFPSTELKTGNRYDQTTVCNFATILPEQH